MNRILHACVARDNSSFALRIKTILQVTRGICTYIQRDTKVDAFYMEDDNGESRDRSEKIWVAVRGIIFVLCPGLFVGVEMYLQEIRMNGKPIGKTA